MPANRDVEQLLDRLTSLRHHQQDGRRSPHKPLLVLLALGRLATTGSSTLPRSVAETELAKLVAEFGPSSRIGVAQCAAYPSTRPRADGVWAPDGDVPGDKADVFLVTLVKTEAHFPHHDVWRPCDLADALH